MKSSILLFIVSVFLNLNLIAQTYTGPVAKPTSGYGSDGAYSVAVQSFTNPNFSTQAIRVYYPSGIASHVPTLFYSHAFGGNDPSNISGFLNFVAKKGYAVVFVPYQTIGVTVEDRYNNLLQGFIKAARDYPNIIDTTKVGFVGHSFGGGAVFANSYYCFKRLNWGTSGRFIFSMAQWYSYNMPQDSLTNFPLDVKLLSIVYDNDSTNDQRMANDVFNTINIPASEKDYLLVKSDTINGYVYNANHVVPNNAAYDALDYYAYYRLIDAMCDYVFNGNAAGKEVALGNGSASQVTMPGGMKKLVETDTPNIQYDESRFLYPCNSSQNPREQYCTTSSVVENSENTQKLYVFPNPVISSATVFLPSQQFDVEIVDSSGRKRMSRKNVDQSAEINLTSYSKGVYLVKAVLKNGKKQVCKIIKE